MTLTSLNDLPSAEIASATIESEQQTDLVISALLLIERVGSSKHLPAVRRLVQSDDPPVRARALRVLARLGTADDVHHLRSGLEDRSHWVVLHAARALREMGRTDVLSDVANSELPAALAARELMWEVRV
jgi:HEAT repeat protein